jgi:hypothetical protein
VEEGTLRAPDLIEELGPEVARKLAENYGGLQHRIPTVRMVDLYVRNSAILSAWKLGCSQPRIAVVVGTSLSVVRAVIAAARKLEREMKK